MNLPFNFAAMKIEVGPAAPTITETATFSFRFRTMPIIANIIPNIPTMISRRFFIVNFS